MNELVQTALAANDTAPVGSGRITGGWGYVWFAYGITWLTLIAYGVSLWVRRPGQKTKDAKTP